jgi:hypothetical protein
MIIDLLDRLFGAKWGEKKTEEKRSLRRVGKPARGKEHFFSIMLGVLNGFSFREGFEDGVTSQNFILSLCVQTSE